MTPSEQELSAHKGTLTISSDTQAQHPSDVPLKPVKTKRRHRARRRESDLARPDAIDSIDTENLQAEIRLAVAEKTARRPSAALLAPPLPKNSARQGPKLPTCARDAVAEMPVQSAADLHVHAEAIYPIDWLAIDASLTRVRQHVEIGRGLPELARLKTPFRHLARVAAGAILFVGRFLTNRQSAYNIAGLTALHQLAEGIRRMHLSYNEQIKRLERQVMALRQELSKEK
jgi:hypothetical protein